MSMNDPISDFLSRVRNAVRAHHTTVDIPASGVKAEICRVLKEEGFISDYVVSLDPVPGLIRVTLKYDARRTPVLQGLKRVSKPSLRRYVSADDIKQVRSGLGIAIISTSKGVMTRRKAREQKVGGELLCNVW